LLRHDRGVVDEPVHEEPAATGRLATDAYILHSGLEKWGKDVWMLGIGLGLLVDAIAERRRR